MAESYLVIEFADDGLHCGHRIRLVHCVCEIKMDTWKSYPVRRVMYKTSKYTSGFVFILSYWFQSVMQLCSVIRAGRRLDIASGDLFRDTAEILKSFSKRKEGRYTIDIIET